MRKSRLSALLLAAALAISPASAAQSEWLVSKTAETPAFSDTAGTWCEDAVKTVCEAGLMNGKSETAFDPGGSLTYCQVIAITARLLERLAPEKFPIPARENGDAWYAPYYRQLWAAVENQVVFYPYYFAPDVNNNPPSSTANEPCPREEFVRMLSYALLCAGVTLPEKNDIPAVPDVYPGTEFGNAGPDILTFYRAGILSGTGEWGAFQGASPLNRGQAAAMLARLIDPAQRLEVTLKPFSFCRDAMLLEPDTILAEVDGIPVTADEASQLITYCKSKEALLDSLRRIVAQRRLVEEREILWSLEDLESRRPSWPGYQGISQTGIDWDRMDIYFFTLLNNNQEPDPHMGMDGFYDGLYREIDAKKETITARPTEALEQFDFAAFSARLEGLPL